MGKFKPGDMVSFKDGKITSAVVTESVIVAACDWYEEEYKQYEDVVFPLGTLTKEGASSSDEIEAGNIVYHKTNMTLPLMVGQIYESVEVQWMLEDGEVKKYHAFADSLCILPNQDKQLI